MSQTSSPSEAGPGPHLPRTIEGVRACLVLLLVLLATWFLRWTEAQTAGGGVEFESGPPRSGAVAAASMIVLWGTGLTLLLARSRRALRAGGALTDAALALFATGLLAGEHPWIPGGDLRAGYIPIFAPLALLALLDAVVLLRRRDAGDEVAWIRAGAGLFAAGALFVDQAWLPCGMALWMGTCPLLLLRLPSFAAARFGLQLLLLAAALMAFFAPDLHSQLVTAEQAGAMLEGRFGWQVVSAGVVVLALYGLWRSLLTPAPTQPA